LVDASLVMIVLTQFNPTPSGPVMLISVWGYYFACDMLFERTLGKIVTGMFYLTKDELPLAKGALASRAFLRFLLIFGVLSWRKTTLVDLLTGIRVYTRVVPPKSAVPVQSRRQMELDR
jgi:hypothetical protein